MLKTLVVGIAGRGSCWARATEVHPEFELAGFADIDSTVLAERGEEFNVRAENRHTDLGEALRSGQYDVAVVVVPNHLHYPVARDVLGAGVHCLLEKPFTEELAHAEELVALADAKKCVLQIGQNFRFMGVFRFVAEAVADQRLGRLAGVNGRFHRYRPPRYDHERSMPFPMLYLQAIHHLDWLVSVLPSPIVDVFSRHQRVPWSEFENPSICHIVLQCEDGAIWSWTPSRTFGR